MKKLNNKKGLFLAEILLAVVIAAVIMGSGFLVYKNIKSENEKNDAVRDLNMILSMVTPIFIDERGQADFNGDGTLQDNASLIKTKLFVRASIVPNTLKTTKESGDTSGNDSNIISSYGYPLSIGLAELQETSNWRVQFHNLDQDQCAKLVQAGIAATSPMAVSTGTNAGATNSLLSGNGWSTPMYSSCAFESTPLQIVENLCITPSDLTDGYDVSFYYSPNNEELVTPVACTSQGRPA